MHRPYYLTAAAAEATLFCHLVDVPQAQAQTDAAPPLSGHVTSAEEGTMEGVIEPQDVVFADGYAWCTNFGEEYIRRLNPKTGAHREFPAA